MPMPPKDKASPLWTAEQIISINLMTQRARRRWSRHKLAMKSGVRWQMLRDIEEARISPRIGTLMRLAKALGILTVELFGMPDDLEANRGVKPILGEVPDEIDGEE